MQCVCRFMLTLLFMIFFFGGFVDAGKQPPHLFAVSFYGESHYLLTKDKKEGQNTSTPEDQGTFFVLQLQHLITRSWLRLPSYSSSGMVIGLAIIYIVCA